jgi:hypothetical protein
MREDSLENEKDLDLHLSPLWNWWASRESNTAPTDYESAALTKHELEAQNRINGGAHTPPAPD